MSPCTDESTRNVARIQQTLPENTHSVNFLSVINIGCKLGRIQQNFEKTFCSSWNRPSFLVTSSWIVQKHSGFISHFEYHASSNASHPKSLRKSCVLFIGYSPLHTLVICQSLKDWSLYAQGGRKGKKGRSISASLPYLKVKGFHVN